MDLSPFFQEWPQNVFLGSLFLEAADLIVESVVRQIVFPAFALSVFRDERLFDVFIEFVKVDIGQNRANDSPLRCSARGGSEAPFFEISGLEQVLDQVQETVIVDFLSEYRYQDLMIDVIEKPFDISFDEPFRTVPGVEYFPQRGMASSSWPETMRVGAELRLVVCVQYGSHHFLQHLIGPRRDAEWSQFSILLGDVNSADREPSISFLAEECDDVLDLPRRHAIHGFVGNTFCQRTIVSIETSVRLEVQIRVIEASIGVFQSQTASASFGDDGQCRFGVSHVAYLYGYCPLTTCPASPCVRLSRTRTTIGTPSPWGSRPLGDLDFPCCHTSERGLGSPLIPTPEVYPSVSRRAGLPFLQRGYPGFTGVGTRRHRVESA